ncbi:hypothetical protein D9619_011107 [Psilocybe cf. subviscida]|uniref:Uncharacterized protein n=1 Tax=Psilocybe cf. subviscida TaxID=2480587 RepID=A0A8H5BJQ8_9AGAR|nr:hypothetical protein D9619_011107 [Psilocybe cf. subviscida]
MFHDMTPQMAGLVSNWCDTMLYGIVIVTYFTCTYVLIKHRGDRNQMATWILIVTSTVQFILSTIYVAVALSNLIEGFVRTENVPNGAFIYWINPATKSQVIAKAVYITNSVVGDFILIWRLYMVWGKNLYVCLLPIIITCCAAVTGYVSDSKLAAISGNVKPTSVFEVLNWILSTWCLSIATQVISTSLIAGRIWWHARHNPVARSRYMSLIAIIVESGAIYTLSTAFLLAFADLKTQAGALIAHMTTQLATIVPTLIIIRVELDRNKAMRTWGGSDLTKKNQSFALRPMVFGSACRRDSGHGDSFPQISIPTLAASDVDLKEAKCAV